MHDCFNLIIVWLDNNEISIRFLLHLHLHQIQILYCAGGDSLSFSTTWILRNSAGIQDSRTKTWLKKTDNTNTHNIRSSAEHTRRAIASENSLSWFIFIIIILYIMICNYFLGNYFVMIFIIILNLVFFFLRPKYLLRQSLNVAVYEYTAVYISIATEKTRNRKGRRVRKKNREKKNSMESLSLSRAHIKVKCRKQM